MEDQQQSKEQYLADERLIIKHSGEIPEVAFHGSLYYLTEDPDGPGLEISRADMAGLEEMVVARYRTILLRDLDPENRDKRIYRGLARCAANWRRLRNFARGKEINIEPVRAEAAQKLLHFLGLLARERKNGSRSFTINCSARTLFELAEDFGLERELLPEDVEQFCRPA